MRSKILGIALFILTAAAVIYYPQLMAKTVPPDDAPPLPIIDNIGNETSKVDLVFVLDTTGSMGGLIQTAKEKIWSIATTMASAQTTPDVRIGLVAYRDRGDAYVTRVVDLSDDLDSVYATLMDFEAGGGGDTPESVNEALYDAVHEISWANQDDAYQVIFLVGDAPPHMDYNEVQFPQIVASATEKGIVINTIQCGEIPSAVAPWTQIASIGGGEFFQVEQAGGAVAYDTPYDEEIATLAAKMDDTRLYYGNAEEKELMRQKTSATDKLNAHASFASRARRGVFNTSEGGRANLLGKKELVDAISSGSIALEELEADVLPESIAAMAPAEQEAHIAVLASERADIQDKIKRLSADRDEFIAKKVEEAGGLEDSLDRKLYETIKTQGSAVGLEYEDGPAY